MIDLEKSAFQEIPHGGLSWEYEILPKSQKTAGFIRLDAHSGKSVVPYQSPPTSIDATVSTLFDILRDKSRKRMNIPGSKTLKGISIGYSQCKVKLVVTAPWSNKIEQYPEKGNQCGGHQLCITHQFRGGPENTIPPKRASVGNLTTELVADVLEEGERL
jgi:hypothetical protein